MKKSIFLSVITFLLVGLSMNNSPISLHANEEDYFAKTIYKDGNIDYITYDELGSSITETEAYIPDDSIELIESIIEDEESEVMPLEIFGEDDRVLLNNSSAYTTFPYRAVVYITCHTNGSSAFAIGTGALVGPSTVITAAHIVQKQDGSRYDSYNIYAGGHKLNNTFINPYPVAHDVSITFGRSYDTRVNADDWAIIDLDWELGNSTGYFGVSSTAISVNSRVRLYGYHCDFNGCLGYGPGNVKNITTIGNNAQFYHDCDARAGSSGGPITFGAVSIVGVHSGGVDSTQDAAAKITPYIANLINSRL